MKLTFFLILVATLQVSATGWAQTVSISQKNIALRDVFKEIRKQTGYEFLYNIQMLNQADKVDIHVKDASVEKVLSLCLQGQPFTFAIVEKTIIIKPREETPPVVAASDRPAPPPSITGVVTGPDGVPLPGVSVVVKATGAGTSTNARGEFELKNIPENAILVISFVGYTTQEVKAGAGQKPLRIVLQPQEEKLQEVVVNGYQSIQKKQFTGAAATLNADDVKLNGVTDISRMLEGRAAGVSVQNVSGTFGAAPKVRVRGATSITGENKPLWVVDGIVLEDIVNISNDQLSSGDPTTLLGSAVAGINAEDIQSFEILKDASATALYGARAMNGVIVITTKKGKAGNPVINYTGNFTVKLKPSYDNFNIMNSADQMSVYAEMMRKGWLNHVSTSRASDGGVFTKMYQLINTYDPETGEFGLENTPEARAAFLDRYARANTDWFDVLFRNSLLQEHSLSISSGTSQAQYYISTSFLNDQGWTIGDNVKRYTMNLRANYKFSDKLSANFITTGSVRQQKAPGSNSRVSNTVEGRYTRDFDINPFSYALNTSRVLTAYDENGQPEYFTRNFAPFNIINELGNNNIILNMMDLKLQGELGYRILKNLEYKVLGAVRMVKTSREHKIRENSNMALAYRANYDSYVNGSNRFLYNDPDDPNTERVVVLPKGGFYNRTEDHLVNYNIRNQLTWNQTFRDKHSVNMLAGQEIKYTDRQNAWNNGFGYQYDKGGVPFIDYRILKQMLEGNYNYYGMDMFYDRFVAFYSNGSYSFDDRYIFNGTLRYDGSNRMGKSSRARWLPTWTLSAAWNIDEEAFMQNVKNLDYLKLRGSYGLTASLGQATNSTVVLENSSTRRPILSDVESQIGISNLENSELTWEKQYEANIGVDLSLFRSKLSVTIDAYKRNGFDLIGPVRTNGIGGQSSKFANYADMKSHGVEVTVGTRWVKTKNWNYNTNFTFGYNKNRITNLKNTPRIFDLVQAEGGYKEGHSVRGLYSIEFKGLDPFNGMPVMVNESGKDASSVYVQSTNTSYLKYEGPVDPTITGGFNHNITYKNFMLNIFFTYQAGNKIRLSPVYKTSYTDLDAMPKEFLDRWTLPGDELVTNVPSMLYWLNAGQLGSEYPYSNYNYSTARVADGGFVRLKTASLQYIFTPAWLKPIGAKSLALNLAATNLWLIYADPVLKGQDPEFFASGGVALPMPKQFTLSAKLGF